MSFLHRLRKTVRRPNGSQSRPARVRPALEPLEDRFCPSSYSVLDLGTLGGASSSAQALNEVGQVVGQSATVSGEQHAFLWQNGGMTDLGTLGGSDSAANDVNDSGQVVGTLGVLPTYANPNPPPSHAFLWQNGVMTDIGGSEALAINNAGQIVGVAGANAVVWENGVMYDLNSLLPASPNLHFSYAYDINDSRQLLAWGTNDGPWGAENHPMVITDDDGIFANGGAVLTDLQVWMGYGTANDLNNLGQAAGSTNDAEGWSYAVIYSDGYVGDIIGEDGSSSYAYAINDAGRVVGTIMHWSTSYRPHAFVYQVGQRDDLNNLIDSSSGWTLTDAFDINQGGDIVGTGTIAGQTHAFLATESNLPSLTINDVSVAEGNAGTTNAVFTVTLSAASTQEVTVAYAASNGRLNPAYPGSDFQALTGTLTFAPGETSKTITVMVTGDTTTESDETFLVTLGSHVNAVVARSQGVGIIVNDDPPLLVIRDVTITEGNSGTQSATFAVWIYYPFTQTVTVNFATANGTATAPDDYQSTSGTLTFNPGETNKTITVLINGDQLGEANETFLVNLTNPVNAILSDGQAVCTIADDDPVPALSISDVTQSEGNLGLNSTSFSFTVSLSKPSAYVVNYSFTTVNGTAGSADYLAKSGHMSIPVGTTTQTITILVNGDTSDEANETFFVNLSSSTNPVARSQGVGTIVDDDPPPAPPSLRINDVSRTEGRSGITYFVFTVTLSAPSSSAVTVNFATANGTAKTSNNDYLATSGKLTFAGETTKTITVQVMGDKKREGNETFFVNLTGAVDATIADSQGRGTILDDD